ncbi:MAG: hypothetical protein O9309_03455 [Rhizobium sp.]|nr:hypothetical protein [Rhizobium sp.]MCZ8351397.1 hypothetical protein [Rhizobium sp.]
MAIFRVGVAIYLSAMLVIATRVSVNGDNSFLWIAHSWLVIVLAISAYQLLATGEVLRTLRDPAAWLILLFFGYFILMAATYPDPEIARQYLKDAVRNCLVSFLCGYLFAVAPRASAEKDWAILIGMGACVIAVFFLAAPQMRGDIFLVLQPGWTPQYQYFGDQLTVVLIGGVMLLSAHSGPWASGDYLPWSIVPFVFVAGFFAAQLVGSNNATVLMGMLAVALGAATVMTYWQKGMTAAACHFFLAVGIATAIWVAVIAAMPPMRIFNFGDGEFAAKVPGYASIVSRADLSGDSLAQFKLAPLLGDLAADKIVGNPGGYLHSILAVQSHLGLVGSALLFMFLAVKLRCLYSSGPDIRKWITPPILTVAFLATFFTWQPLWFLIGMLMPIRNRKSKKNP